MRDQVHLVALGEFLWLVFLKEEYKEDHNIR